MSRVYIGKLCVYINVYRVRALRDLLFMLCNRSSLFRCFWCHSLVEDLHLREVKDVSVAASPAVISHLSCTLPALLNQQRDTSLKTISHVRSGCSSFSRFL